MKKVVLINNGLSGGGTERASISFAHYLLKQGFDVTILALYKSVPFYKLNPRVQFIEPEFSREHLYTYSYILKMMNYVRQHIKTLKPDSVLSYNEWTNAYILLACFGLRTPVYVSERMHPKAKLPLPTELLRKWLYPRASGIITQTSFGKKVLQERTRAKNITVVPNAVKIIEPKNVPKKKQIISIGRLEKVKGHRFLIEAFTLVEDKDWTLCIIGDGSQRLILEKLAAELNIRNRVKFKGHQLDLRKELSESEIFVLPSIKEGFPNALIEAMSVPLACISGDYYDGEHDLVRHEVNGLLFPPSDSTSLGKALNRLTTDSNLRDRLKNEAVKVRKDLAPEIVYETLKSCILPDERN